MSDDLAIDLTGHSRGRPPKAVNCEIVRALTSEDLTLLESRATIAPSPIKRIRESHHALARCIAAGLSGAETSEITGYSISRISILKGDPSFRELVAFYRQTPEILEEREMTSGYAAMEALRRDAVEELHVRIQEVPETFSHDQVLDVVKVTADRTGLGPSSTSRNLNANLTVNYAEQYVAGQQRAARLSGQSPVATPAVETGPTPQHCAGEPTESSAEFHAESRPSTLRPSALELFKAAIESPAESHRVPQSSTRASSTRSEQSSPTEVVYPIDPTLDGGEE